VSGLLIFAVVNIVNIIALIFVLRSQKAPR